MLPIYQPETAPVSIQDILAGTVLPIGAWVAPPPAGVSGNNPDYITDETYRLAKEAGFTMLYGLYENLEHRREDARRALTCAQRSGLRYLAVSCGLADGQTPEELVPGLIQGESAHPAYLGVLAWIRWGR